MFVFKFKIALTRIEVDKIKGAFTTADECVFSNYPKEPFKLGSGSDVGVSTTEKFASDIEL